MQTEVSTRIDLKRLSGIFDAYLNCIKSNNKEWKDKHEDTINEMLKTLPSGSGIDAGIEFNWDKSTPEKLLFIFGFHHMNDAGYYDGWSHHNLIITPSLQFGYRMEITGKDRNQIKEYLYQLFYDVFTIQTELP